MFERFTERARKAVVFAQDEARQMKHDYIGPEHLLLGLLLEEEGLASRVLESLDITVVEAKQLILRTVGIGSNDAPPNAHLPFTAKAKKVLELTLREALSLGHNYIGTEHILLGMGRDNDNVACEVLAGYGVTPEVIRNEIIRLLSGPRPTVTPVAPPVQDEPERITVKEPREVRINVLDVTPALVGFLEEAAALMTALTQKYERENSYHGRV